MVFEFPIDQEDERFLDVYDRAKAGDETALARLRQQLNAVPQAWEEAGNLALQAEHVLIGLAAGDDAMVREAIERKIGRLKADFGWDDVSPEERLLVDRVAICWLEVHYADTVHARHVKTRNPPLLDCLQRHQDRAQRRYLSAIKTLVQVRRLLVPPVQVNIAQQQVNVAELNTSTREGLKGGHRHRAVRRGS